MGKKYEEAFNEIIFAVATILFGNEASGTVHQNICRLALKNLNIDKVLERLEKE